MTTTKEISPHAIVENITIKRFPIIEPDYYLKLALFYAEKGFFVFPVNPNKIPFKGFSWSVRASNKPDLIKKMWQEYPHGRPALYCKASNILIIDIDNKPEKDKHGFMVLRELVNTLGALPKTVTIYTQSNGAHMYFKLPQNRQFKRKISNCIDIQTNHYCICGGVYTDKGSYRFAKGYTFEEIGEIPELPPKWVEFISKKEIQICKDMLNASLVECYKPKKLVKNIDIQQEIDNCHFLQYCRDFSMTLSEEIWFCMIGKLAIYPNSDSVIHELSRFYDGYSHDETQYKINRAKKFGSRISCNYISSNFPEICHDCKFLKKKG